MVSFQANVSRPLIGLRLSFQTETKIKIKGREDVNGRVGEADENC